jgi:site-specific DNA recombinase
MKDRQQPRRAGIYVRISKMDEDEKRQARQHDGQRGQSLSTQRQERECRALVQRLGWEVAGVYIEDDRSAFTGKARPDYERLLDDLKIGAVDALVAWDSDRFSRETLREIEDFIDLVEATGAEVATVTAGTMDLTTVNGRALVRMAAVMARMESEHKRDRLLSKHAELRDQGKPNGGNRPYGYQRVGMKSDYTQGGTDTRNWVPHPDEAPIVGEVVARIARGETLTRVADDLNERGVPTAKGGKGWVLANVRRMVMNPIYIGQRTYQGEEVGAGIWPGIVDEAIWRRARALLTKNSEQIRAAREARDAGYSNQGGPPRAARRYLLSGGLVFCGKCGTPLRAKPHHDRNAGLVATYACPVKKMGGCGGVSVRADALEQLVADAAFRWVESAKFARSLHRRGKADPSVSKEITRINARKRELTAEYSSGAIDMAWVRSTMADLDARLATAQSRIATDTSMAAAGRYAGRSGALSADWPGLALDRRRAILRAVGTRVVVASVGKGGKRGFDPDRVAIAFG